MINTFYSKRCSFASAVFALAQTYLLCPKQPALQLGGSSKRRRKGKNIFLISPKVSSPLYIFIYTLLIS